MADGPIVHEGRSARYRLDSMGLDPDLLLEVIRRGELARADATANDPITAAGSDAYRYRVRALRDLYGPVDWKRLQINGLELLAKADGNLAIMTKAGDAGVGIRSAFPQPKSEVGEGAAAALGTTLPLFDPEWLQAQNVRRPESEFWMLLVCASAVVVRSELSLGSEIDKRGRVARWFERIILPELDPNNLGPMRHRWSDEPGEDGALDVPVIRKKPA